RRSASEVIPTVGACDRDIRPHPVGGRETVRERAVDDRPTHRVRDDVYARIARSDGPDLVGECGRAAVDAVVGVVPESRIGAKADHVKTTGVEIRGQLIEAAIVRLRAISADEDHELLLSRDAESRPDLAGGRRRGT